MEYDEIKLLKKETVFGRHVATHVGFLKHPSFSASVRLRPFSSPIPPGKG